MPIHIFKKDALNASFEKVQLKKFEEAKTILRWHNAREKTWILWEEKPGLYAIINQSNNRVGSVAGYTFQYCYCALNESSDLKLELAVTNPTETTQNPDAVYALLLTKKIVSGPLVSSFIKQFIEKQHGRNKGIIQKSSS